MGCSGQEVLGPPFLYAPEKYAVSFIWKVNGTIIPLVLSSPLFWFVMLAHGAFLLCFRYFDEPYLPWKAALVPSSLLTFLLVTFVNQCFERYFTLYRFCVGLHGSVMEWSALVKLEFGHMSSNYKWNVLRLLLGALQVHYALLGGDSVTDEDGIVRKGISDDEWRAIRTRNLLSRDEIARLRAYAGFKPFLPVGWALAEVKAGLLGVDAAAAVGTSLGKDLAAREVFSAFREVAFKFRTESSSTFALLNAPVPFAYFHVLKLLMVLSLLIISYALIDLLAGEALLSYIVFGLSSLVMIGLSELAIAMSDPFGDDQADFNLEAFLESVYDNAVGFLTEDRSLRHSGLPVEMHNPLDEPWLRRWAHAHTRTHTHTHVRMRTRTHVHAHHAHTHTRMHACACIQVVQRSLHRPVRSARHAIRHATNGQCRGECHRVARRHPAAAAPRRALCSVSACSSRACCRWRESCVQLGDCHRPHSSRHQHQRRPSLVDRLGSERA